MSLKILIIDDESNIRNALTALLKDEGLEPANRGSAEDALQLLRKESYELIFLDVRLPGMDGLQALEKIKKLNPDVNVIMISGNADLSMAVKATKLGAYNFLEKPLNPEKVLLEVNNVRNNRQIKQEMISLKKMVEIDYQFVGESDSIQKLREEIRRAAPSEGRILIYGENGTGKELVAREIHRLSNRNDKPFVKVNCAAIPKELIESELFGYEKGAFTGAVKRKIGMIEEAHEGTLFLDEIGDMALETQAKLLRVLQESEFRRVGGTTPIRFDVRIISATNKDLNEEINSGIFREDLYYRLNVIPIEVKPLRERKQDIKLLVQHFLNAYSIRNNKRQKKFSISALQPLLEYSWPGNVRELKNLIERLVIMTDGDEITPGSVAGSLPQSSEKTFSDKIAVDDREHRSLRDKMESFEKKVLLQEFEKARGNISKMALNLKTDRANLHRKLKKYYIK